jgi:superfamily I DNA/RNA helicase
MGDVYSQHWREFIYGQTYFQGVNMPAPVYITGHAGTGKTTKLLDRTVEYSQALLLQPNQQLLAMAYMHGARKRLESSLAEHPQCSRIPRIVSTVDSFALLLVNRWRTALGIAMPVCVAPTRCTNRFERYARLHLPFDEITTYAANLLRNPTVARIVALSYPLVAIDEFQDCLGPKLELVRALADASQLILAADGYQLLQDERLDCPAVAWVEGLGNAGLREHHQLTEHWRFSSNPDILLAARAVRQQKRLPQQAIPVYYGSAGQTAWKIMERLQLGWQGPPWSGTTALISPSSGGVIETVLQSLDGQSVKAGRKPIRWSRQATSEQEHASLLTALGVENDHLDETQWQPTADSTNPHAAQVIDRVNRFAHLRGLQHVPKSLVSSIAEQVIHVSRAHARTTPRFVVTTVHGAKNREFDNVCVLWSYQIPPNPEVQRRLLYNAVTRAKSNCIVFDTRKQAIATNDPVITLLGMPKPVFNKKPKAKKLVQRATPRSAVPRKK